MFRESPLHKNAPLSAAVESDVVGYTTVELTKEYTLVGINFSSLDGKDSRPINEVVSGNFTNGDFLQIKDASMGGYTVLRWENNAWYPLGETTPADREVKRGTEIWIVAHNASPDNPVTVQLCGSVKMEDSLTTEFGQDYVIASVGLPMDVDINSKFFSWQGMANGDQLQVQDPRTNGYIAFRWQDGHWYPLGSAEPAQHVLEKERAFWLYSNNAEAKVSIQPTNL